MNSRANTLATEYDPSVAPIFQSTGDTAVVVSNRTVCGLVSVESHRLEMDIAYNADVARNRCTTHVWYVTWRREGLESHRVVASC